MNFLRLLQLFLVILLFANAPAFAQSGMSAEQLFRKGYSYDTGEGAAQNDKLAAEWYTLAAEKGSAPAQRNLAGLYGSGRGVKENQKEATRLFLLAAKQGDAQAQYAYANWYTKKKKVKIEWLRLSAAQGHQEAIALLKKMKVPLVAE